MSLSYIASVYFCTSNIFFISDVFSSTGDVFIFLHLPSVNCWLHINIHHHLFISQKLAFVWKPNKDHWKGKGKESKTTRQIFLSNNLAVKTHIIRHVFLLTTSEELSFSTWQTFFSFFLYLDFPFSNHVEFTENQKIPFSNYVEFTENQTFSLFKSCRILWEPKL